MKQKQKSRNFEDTKMAAVLPLAAAAAAAAHPLVTALLLSLALVSWCYY